MEPSSPSLLINLILWAIDYFCAQYASGSSFNASRDIASFTENFGFGVNSPSGWMVRVRK